MRLPCLALLSALLVTVALAQDCPRWDGKGATSVGRSMRISGQVGGEDWRIVNTDRSYNYKLRATWLTPEVICAAARLAQISQGLSEDETQALVVEAEKVSDTVILVEIDPREGSGVIPRDWIAQLRPRTQGPDSTRMVRGVSAPQLRELRALAGTERSDYAYDVFWVVFPLHRPDGKPVFADSDAEAELVVRIYDKVGRVRWTIPDSIRKKMSSP